MSVRHRTNRSAPLPYRCATAQTDGGQTSERQHVRRRSNPVGRGSQATYAWGSPRERREADLFLADLLGRPPRRQPQRPAPVAEFDPHPLQEFDPYPVSELDQEAWDEVVQVCGFFGPRNVWRTQQAVRDAIVARAKAEWTAWHNGAIPVAESDATRFGRLVGYSLAANADIAPDHLTALQTAALGAINYAPLLGASNTVAGVRAALITAAAVPNTATMQSRVATALANARQANKDNGAFKSWSAIFVVGCVRGAAIGLGLEANKNELLLATIRHSEYTREARIRRAAGTTGTYQAFTPVERAPQKGDIIVQDRRDNIGPGDVMTLANLPERLETHGDIVIDVKPTFVETIGGNLTRPDPPPPTPSAPTPPPIGDSSRKRRYPRTAQGFLVVDPPQLFAQEDDAGALAALPLTSTEALHKHSTRRIFAVLSLAEECRSPRNLPYPASSLA